MSSWWIIAPIVSVFVILFLAFCIMRMGSLKTREEERRQELEK